MLKQQLEKIVRWIWKQKWFVWGVGNIIVLFFSLSFLKEGDFFKISQVDVTFHGGEYLEDLYPGLKAEFEEKTRRWLGKDLWQVDLFWSGISPEFWMDDVEMRIMWPGRITLKVQVSEVLFIKKEGAKFIPFFSNSEWGPPLGIKNLSEHWTIVEWEQKTDDDDDDDDQERWIEVVSFFKNYLLKHPFSKSVKKIRYDREEGFILELMGGATSVLLGHQLSAERFDRVTQVITFLQLKKLEARVIDAEFDKKVLVKLRNQF
ncbi:MAG: hypothetical protein RMK80_05900 [Pseudobdellovibrionaceae bacterium]|nr:hypothetical protein [Pseudobdellovibrionaceae bacterium]